LIVAILAVYGRAIRAPFIFDDYNSVETNETIVRLWPLVGSEAEPGPLRTPQFAPTSARPLVNLSLALNYSYGGLNPIGYHVVNMVLHMASAILLYAIVRRTLRLPYFNHHYDVVADLLAFLVALLWALHPLQTEAVAYTTQRTELMMGLFYFATLYCSLRYWTTLPESPIEGSGGGDNFDEGARRALATNRGAWVILATLACLAGMTSKEAMASAPLIVLLFDRAFVAGSIAKALSRSWPLYAGLACGWLAILGLHFNSPHSDSAGFHLGVPAHAWWFTQAKVLLMYFKLVVWPWPLVLHYEMPYLDSLTDSWMYLVPVGLLGVTILVLLWRNNPVGFLGTWVFAILLPTLVIPIVTEVAAERRMYLPLAAISALVVVGGYDLTQTLIARRLSYSKSMVPSTRHFIAVAAGLALVLAIVSSRRVAIYNNEMVLWQDVLRLQPHNHVAHAGVGLAYYDAGNMTAATEHFRESVRLKPDSSQAHCNLALVLSNTGQIDEAVEQFRLAVKYRPGSAELLNNLGVTLFIARRYDEAIPVFRQAIEIKPSLWRAHDNLGSALSRAGNLPAAIEKYQHALKLNPQALDVYGHLADAQAKAKQPAAAIATAERALELARNSGAHSTAAKIDAQLAAYRASLSNAENVEISPDFGSALPSD
jgi:Tfp pilus assembly protein PilF